MAATVNAYATNEELKKRLGDRIFDEIYQYVYREGVKADLEAAAAEIDGSVSARYVLPVTGERSRALLNDWNLTLAEERAYARAAGSGFSEKVKDRVAVVRKSLELIREGAFKLPDAEEVGSGGGSGGPGSALFEADTPVFTRERMRGF